MGLSEKKESIDSMADMITSSNQKFLIWGSDDFAIRFYERYNHNLAIIGFIDWNNGNTPSEICGMARRVPDEVGKYTGEYHIIVAERRNKDIAKADDFLDKRGWKNHEGYFNSKEFESIYGVFALDRTIFNFVEMTITEKCSLRCKNCSQFMPYFEHPSHTPLNVVLHDIDTLFRVIDYTFHFRLLGGETLLHPDLEEILRHIVSNYREKIDYFDIATNGTVMPSQETFDLCRNGHVTISISDYGINEKYTGHVDRVVSELQKQKVDYRRNLFDFWFDIGFPIVRDRSMSPAEKAALFDECATDWRNFHDGKLYFCSVCACAQRAGLIDGFRTDYFDLSGDVDRRELLYFDMGCNEKGYNSLCGECKGYMPSANHKHVKPGVQLKASDLKGVLHYDS